MEQKTTELSKNSWRIGVDVGGTFTDMVLRYANGAISVFKVPSVPMDPSKGVMNVLQSAASQLKYDLQTLLSNCDLFVHGSTVATNTILEKKGAKVGLLTTVGFRDSIEVRRGIRENQWDHRRPFPEVLVPRYLRLPVSGRIDRNGEELSTINHEDVALACEIFKKENVESIAICFINSFKNSMHEEQVAEIIGRYWDGGWVSISSQVVPVMGEYERASTCVVNAYVTPAVSGYLQELDLKLKNLGLARPILLLQSNGGAISVHQISNKAVNLVLSGPAAGVGALNLFESYAESDNLISMEIGGTSCDVMLMSQGVVSVSDELKIDGYHIATPSVDIHTVGAGGGTIAWIDDAGLLHVGPHGAGADPGPACYGLGGLQPTVTDAHMVLGRLRPGSYAGGSVDLDLSLAIEVVQAKIASLLNISLEDAAIGIIKLLEQHLLHAVERISVERGYDPTLFTLVAAGGAGPMHGASVGRALGCRRIYVPRHAGAFCALGMLNSDVRQDYLQVYVGDLNSVNQSDLQNAYGLIETRAEIALISGGFQKGDISITREIDLRYKGQLWSIRVILAEGMGETHIREAFEREHDRQFGHIQPEGTIEITALRVAGFGLIDRPNDPVKQARSAEPNPIACRSTYIDEYKTWAEVPVYAGNDLSSGNEFAGPLLIEEETTTVFAQPGDKVEVDYAGNIIIHVNFFAGG